MSGMEFYMIVQCPVCGEEHKVWFRSPVKQLDGYFICPTTNRHIEISIRIGKGRLVFTKQEIQHAYEEAERQEHEWWMEELKGVQGETAQG